MICGTVKACKQDLDSNSIGCRSNNSILDICLYDIEFPDGEVILLTANMIAQAMYAQCDVDRNEYLYLSALLTYDIHKDSIVISLDDQKAIHDSREDLCCTTLCWHMCYQWKDGSTDLLEIAKYTMGDDNKPSFNWWVLHMLTKRDPIIDLVKK